MQAGARVIVSSRKSADVEAAAAELARARRLPRDPRRRLRPGGRGALAAATRERFDSLDILVNNAGAVWGAPLEEFPRERLGQGAAHERRGRLPSDRRAASRAARGRGRARDPARVINIGSIDGLRTPIVENYSYSASKAAVHMLTRHLAKRLAPEHITVNAIAPGPFESKMMAFVLDDPSSRGS